MERAARALNTANLAAYPVDARTGGQSGLQRQQPGERQSPPAGGRRAVEGDAVGAVYAGYDGSAGATHGRKAYYNSNDLKNAIRGAIDDSKVTYVLGYYPAHNTWDGKFHELKVQVDRKGANVRRRLGYFAFADQPLNDKEKNAAFQEALWSPLESTTLGLTLRVAPNAPKPGKLRVVMVVDAKNIQLGQKDDRWTGTLEILFVEQAAADKQPTVIGDAMAVNLKKDTYTAALERGLVLAKDLEMADAGYQLNVAVRDANSGNIGTGHRQNAGTRYPSKITWAMPSSAVWVMESEIEVTPIFPAMRSASP